MSLGAFSVLEAMDMHNKPISFWEVKQFYGILLVSLCLFCVGVAACSKQAVEVAWLFVLTFFLFFFLCPCFQIEIC